VAEMLLDEPVQNEVQPLFELSGEIVEVREQIVRPFRVVAFARRSADERNDRKEELAILSLGLTFAVAHAELVLHRGVLRPARDQRIGLEEREVVLQELLRVPAAEKKIVDAEVALQEAAET